MTTAAEILEWYELRQGSATKADILRAYRLADDGGTIQAAHTVGLFGMADPRLHTTTSLRTALRHLGCVDAE